MAHHTPQRGVYSDARVLASSPLTSPRASCRGPGTTAGHLDTAAHSLSRHLAASPSGQRGEIPPLTPTPALPGHFGEAPHPGDERFALRGLATTPCGEAACGNLADLLVSKITRSSPIVGWAARTPRRSPTVLLASSGQRTGTGLPSRSGASPHPRRRPTARCAAPRVVGRRFSLSEPVSLRRPTFARVRASSTPWAREATRGRRAFNPPG